MMDSSSPLISCPHFLPHQSQVQRRWRSRVRWIKLSRRRAWRNKRASEIPSFEELDLDLEGIGQRYKQHKDDARAKWEVSDKKLTHEDWVEKRWTFNPEYHPMAEKWEAVAKKPALAGGLIGGLRWRGFREVTTSWFGNENKSTAGNGSVSARRSQSGSESARLSRPASGVPRDFSVSLVGKWMSLGTDGKPVVQERPL